MSSVEVRLATPGEVGLVVWHLERAGVEPFGPNLHKVFFSVLCDGEHVGAVQLYWGHAPDGVLGLGGVRWGWCPTRWPLVDAFRQLMDDPARFGLGDVKRIEALPRAEDRMSRANLERAGFKLEGVVQKWYLRGGSHVDAAMYAYLPKGH